ncbi:hypothetical protein [Microvirga rosea]|uniref:hypothetical protein n=1 Tax=Microvirga rosea TaxID=2715425 RepID=UPI001D0AD93A|nr:hypothetical protein [Microvirga rosea]MCB8820911.1 hypothetical protein [Microvirga rosea]
MITRRERFDRLEVETLALMERERVQARDGDLADVAYPHFPMRAERSINHVALGADAFICHEIRDSMITIWRRAGRTNSFSIEFGHGAPTSACLDRLAAAIADRNPWRYQKAWDGISRGEQREIRKHIALRWRLRCGDIEEPHFLSPLYRIIERFRPEDDAFWSVALEVIQRRKRAASSRRRPRNQLGDSVALALAQMWSCLAGRPIVVPHAGNGTSELTGSMMAFIRDAAQVYPEARISFHSTSAWARILRPELLRKSGISEMPDDIPW